MSTTVGNMQIAEYGKSTQFKPGHKSTGCRPVGGGPAALKAKLEKYLSLDTQVVLPDGTKEKREVIDRIVLSMLNKAAGGDMGAIKEVFDRFYGKLSDKVELTGKDGEPLQINHTAHLETLYGGMMDAFEVKKIEEK